MLTSSEKRTNFPSVMRGKINISLLLLSVLLLHSCYTLLNPPQTLPQTLSTVTTEVAMGSSLGGSVFSGWDPYWEPVLPFTNYYRGYGASYYDPYNYYDYHDPYYAPVYVKGEKATPIKGREFGRDDKQANNRIRDPKNTSNGQLSGGSSVGLSTAAPAISIPAVTQPKPQPKKQAAIKSVPVARESKREIKAKVKAQPKSQKKKEPEKADSSTKKTRTRTKK